MSDETLREALAQTWKDGHRAGIGCGHDLAVCRHDDKAVEAEVDDLASWNPELQAALSAPAPTVDAAALRETIEAMRWPDSLAAADQPMRGWNGAIDKVLALPALRASAPGDEG